MEQLLKQMSVKSVLALRDTRGSLGLGYATGELGNKEIQKLL